MKRHVKRETAIKHLHVSRAPFPYFDPPQSNNNHRHRLLFQLNKKAVDSAGEVGLRRVRETFRSQLSVLFVRPLYLDPFVVCGFAQVAQDCGITIVVHCGPRHTHKKNKRLYC